MFLKRFVYVNWGNIPSLEFDFGPVNLFSGGNGSGKTTAADAIQTIMTAAHENLFQYNPGQDETTQRGRGGKRVRTLASYVLGCDDGSYGRLDPTDGYLAAVFHPTEGEAGEPFTAVIGVRAWLDSSGNQQVARQDEAMFFILPGEQLALAHFVREDKAGKYVVPLDGLQTLLIQEFGKRRVEKYDTKKAYLRRLYGALRGRADAVAEQEAIAAARAFSRFMAYKPVQSIDRFVADEILEQKDLGEAIRSVSSQLKTIHAMERDAGRLVDSIRILDEARVHSQLYIERWIELNVLDYTLAQHEYDTRQREYLKAKQDQKAQTQALKESEAEVEQVQAQSAQLHDQIVQLEAQRLGIPALRQKDELEAERKAHDKQLVEQGTELLVQDRQVQQNIDAAQQILRALPQKTLIADLPQAVDLQVEALARETARKGQEGRIEAGALVQRDLSGDLSALERQLEQARALQHTHNRFAAQWHEAAVGGRSLREQLAQLGHQRERQHESLVAQHRQKKVEIERLEAHQVNYPPYVERALAALRAQCPAADPRVLCDHVEVRDPRWQAAIEGYLGGARFSILVEPAYEAQAIRIVRGLPGRDNKARIIQGEKAAQDAASVSLDADSVIQVLDFTHATARHYLVASYGSVLRVESAEQLRTARRGLTADGMASGNYSMWRCDVADGELVFGAAARERALRAKQDELERIQTERGQAQERWQQAVELLKAVDGLKPLTYADRLDAILRHHRELQRLDGLLAHLDLGAHKDLEAKLQGLKRDELALRNREGDINKRIGELRGKLDSIAQRCKTLGESQDQNRAQVEQHEAALRAIGSIWPDFDTDVRLAQADTEAVELNPEHAKNHRLEVEKALHANERKLSEALAAHNQHCRPSEAIAYVGFDGDYDLRLFKGICAIEREIDRVYNILKNNILVEKHAQLKELKASFNNAFVTHLCHSIYQAINDSKRQIDLLNKELQHHRFGSDRETFRFDSEWVPEYRDYARFFEEVVKNPSLGDEVTLFEADLTARSKQVLQELMTMLLDDDEQRALRELERIADYRNYRRYEIYKEVEGKPPIPLSEYGTGSGGQLETPAYIIRSAAITSAFRFAEGNTHLRMVLVDEAFSKMDESRSREVIGYLTKSLGLQLVFIMPTSKCGPYMDLISNEFVFAKVPSEQPRGQLHTRVLVDRKQCDTARIIDLWAHHRRTVYQQAELDFMKEFAAQA
jgi:energy-coupling factor transporter ATP-binding protein EcfA2